MNRWKKPLLINGVIVAVLILYVLVTSNPVTPGNYIPRFAFSGLMILLLAPINLVVGMVRNRNRKNDGPVYIALSGILLLIGFSVCSIQ